MNALENQFFSGFSQGGKEALYAHLKVESFVQGAYLFHEGDTSDGVYLVTEGDVEILRTAGTTETILGVFHPGEFLGEAAVLDGHGRSTCARSRGDVTVVKVPADPLLDVLAKEPVSLTMNLFQQVLTYFRRTNDLYLREVVHKEKLALVGEMAASLMHDLRNPLSGIRLGADLLGMMHEDKESVRCCDGIRIQCDRVVAMATDLLDVSRGEVKLHLRHTDTVAFLEQFEMLNHDYLTTAGPEITFEAEPAEIEIDSMRLLRLLQNLVTNAVEALSQSAVGKIQVRAWVRDSQLNLTVTDNGPGISDVIRDRIFEPFATFGKKGGTGLGMAIVRNVVRAHHGTITFETEAGQGTRFLVRLPQVQGPVHSHPHEEEAKAEEAALPIVAPVDSACVESSDRVTA